MAAALARRHLRDGALRPHLELARGAVRRARPLRLQPRRQAGQAADRVRAAGQRPRVRPRRPEDRLGCPIAVEVFEGDTADPAPLADQVAKLKERFARGRVVLVSGSSPRTDRGMLTSARLEQARRPGWDHGAASAGDPGAGRRQCVAAVAVRPARSRRDHLAGLSGRAPRGVPQPGSGGRAPAQAGGVACSPRTWSGICARRWHRCCSRITTGLPALRPSPQGSRPPGSRPAHGPRPKPPPRVSRCTASARCSPTSPPSPAYHALRRRPARDPARQAHPAASRPAPPSVSPCRQSTPSHGQLRMADQLLTSRSSRKFGLDAVIGLGRRLGLL